MKLLSPKSFDEFDAQEYYDYIKSLNCPREFTSTRKEQKDLKVRVKRKKDGTLSIVTKRNPPYVTEKEIEKIIEGGIGRDELCSRLRDKGVTIHPNHKAAAEIASENNVKV